MMTSLVTLLVALRLKAFPAALLVTLLLTSAMPGATDVSGTWSGFPISLILKQDGNTVTGSAGETEDDQIPFQSGSIEGNRITLKSGLMEISLVVQGDQMSGEVYNGTKTTKMVFRRLMPRNPSAPPPAFDAASVKRSPPQRGSSMKADPGRLTGVNVPLKRYVIAAWGVRAYQVSAPNWMDDERYDLTASMPAGTPRNEVMLMLRALLVERFRLATHLETKEMAVYSLVVERNGVKLKPAEELGGSSISINPNGSRLLGNMTMKSFTGTLSGLLDRPVVDRTGLTAGFNINLQWARDELQSNPSGNDGTSGDSVHGPTIFTALHEIGLKLASGKAPVEILVVDHAEKVPTEN